MRVAAEVNSVQWVGQGFTPNLHVLTCPVKMKLDVVAFHLLDSLQNRFLCFCEKCLLPAEA